MTTSALLHLPHASAQFADRDLKAIAAGFEEAIERVGGVLCLGAVDVFAVHAPDMTIPGWGCGGYTYSAHSVMLAVDSADPPARSRVATTLVHEFHHVMRERGPGCGTSLRERIVSEGLAMLFEMEIFGTASEFAHQPVTVEQERLVLGALDEDPADDGRWFFHSADMPLWLGYTVGYRWARSYADEHGLKASDLVAVPAVSVTELVEVQQ